MNKLLKNENNVIDTFISDTNLINYSSYSDITIKDIS